MSAHAPGPARPGAVLRGGLAYFACVFGAGFVLGPVRVLWLVPQVGTRTAELLEMPVMALVIVLCARWLHARTWRGLGHRERAWLGLFTVGCVLVADIAVGLGLRGMSLAGVFLARDPVSGSAYYALLALCGALPWLLFRPPSAAAAPTRTTTHAHEDRPRP